MDLGSISWAVEVDTTDLSRAEREMDGTRDAANGAKRGVDDFGDSATRAGRKVRTATERMERDMRSTSRATDMLRNAVSGLVGALGVREVIRYADAWQNAENMIRLVTDSTGELADMQERVTRTAIETRSSFEGTARLYSRLARSTTELKLSQDDLIGLTRTINQSFAISGATAEEASNAITQLSQGFQSGALRGEEFNSVSEQAPGILRAVSDSLKMNIGDLRDFAATGGITAEIVVNALQQASESIENDFSRSVATFGQQMEVARTQMTQFVGENSNVRSVVSGLGNLIVGVTGNINEHSTAFNAVTGAIGGAATAYYGYAIAAGVAQKATVLFMRVLKVNPLILAATAIASIGGALYAARDASIEFGDTQGTLTQWMQGTWTTLSNIVGTTFSGAIDTASAAFGGFGQKATSVLSYLWETFQALMGNIVGIAQASINGVIAYFVTLGDTGRIVANAIYEGFNNAFDNIVSIASQFGNGLQAMLDGDFSFTGFRSALRAGIVDPMRQAVADIADAAQENFGTDYVGDFVDFTGTAIRQMGQDVQRHVRGMNAEFRTLDGWLLSTPENISKIPPELEEVGKKAKESASSVSRLDESVNSLLNRLDPVRARTQAYAQGVSLLNTALATGTLNFGDYQRGMVALQEELYAVEEATDKATSEMQKAWEQRMERMDAAGVDMWRSFLMGSEDALSSFKNLAINTLAEIIHAYTTQKITASLGINLGGAGGTSGGGFGRLISSGRSLLGLGASSQTAGTALGGMSGGLSTAAITSANQVAGGGLMSSITGGISAAAPWLSGGFAVDNILGLGITDGIMNAIGGLFGSSPTKFSGRFGTRNSAAPGTFEHQGSDTEQFYQQGAFGSVGFLDEGTKRLQRAGMGDNKQWAEELAIVTAQNDNMTASLAQTTEELKVMRDAVQGLEISTGNAADIIDFALKERPRAAIEAMTGDFGKFVQSLEGGIEEIAQQGQTAQQALGVMQSSMGRLNLQFDATGAAAYEAASLMSHHAGGVDQLSAVQDAYYQAAFSNEERLQHQHEDVRGALNALTDANITSIDHLRELVEAQDLNSEAGARLALDLMALAPALRESSSAVRGAIEAQYQSSLGRDSDADGMAYWFSQVTNGAINLEGALWHIANSTEAAKLGLEEVAEAAEDFGVLDSAMSALQKSVRAETSALQEQYQARRDALTAVYQDEKAALQSRIQGVGESIQRLTSITQMLSSAVQDTELDTLSLQRSRRTQAQGFLASQLAAGRVTDVDALEKALDTIRQPSEALYSTFADYARDQLTTSNVISQLEEKTEAALSVEEKMLKELQRQETTLDDNHRSQLDALERQHNSEVSRLDGILERAQQQVDAIKGVDSSIMSVLEALGVFNDASTGAGGDSVGGGASQGTIDRITGGHTGVSGSASAAINSAYQDVLGTGAAGFQLTSWADWLTKGAGREGRLDEAVAWANLPLGGEDWLKEQGLFDAGIPKFANGGSHEGGWRVVGERGPEIEYTGPSRIMSNSDMNSKLDNAQVKEAVDQMNRNLEAVLRGILEASQETASIIDDWDTLGQPRERNIEA